MKRMRLTVWVCAVIIGLALVEALGFAVYRTIVTERSGGTHEHAEHLHEHEERDEEE